MGSVPTTWHEADVVLLFDDFHLPRHTVIALTQGLKSAKATQAPLAHMADTSSKVDEVENIRVGHLLRWLKQMVIRRDRPMRRTEACAHRRQALIPLFPLPYSLYLIPFTLFHLPYSLYL
jgi:hypothetical protein